MEAWIEVAASIGAQDAVNSLHREYSRLLAIVHPGLVVPPPPPVTASPLTVPKYFFQPTITQQEEDKANFILAEMMGSFVKHVLPALDALLKNNAAFQAEIAKSGSLSDQDPHQQLKFVAAEKKRKPAAFLPTLAASTDAKLSLEARLDVFHHDPLAIHSSWQTYYSAWANVVGATGDQQAASELRSEWHALR